MGEGTRSTGPESVADPKSSANPEGSGEALLPRLPAAKARTPTAQEEEHASSFPIGEAAIRGGFDCSGVDFPSSLSLASFRGLRKRFSIPLSVSLLQPLPEDLPTRPRKGYAAVHEASLRGGLRLPFQSVIQDLLVRLNVHAAQMSPSFYRIVAACHMMLHRAKGRAVTADDIRNLVAVFDVPGKSGSYKV